jgi:hypothetical protein
LLPLQVENERNTYDKGMGLNEWNIVLEGKYIIRLEDGKAVMSFTRKSFASKLLHH